MFELQRAITSKMKQ